MPFLTPYARHIRIAVITLAALALLGFGALPTGAPAANANPITCSPYSAPLDQREDIGGGHAPSSQSDDVVEPMCAGGIPNRLLTSGGGVKLSAFPVKTKTGYKESRGQAWSIDKDTAGHGDRAWKLKDTKGKRVASLYADGMIAKID